MSKAWKREEIKTLKRLYASGMSFKCIAEALPGRTPTAAQAMRASLRIPTRATDCEAWKWCTKEHRQPTNFIVGIDMSDPEERREENRLWHALLAGEKRLKAYSGRGCSNVEYGYEFLTHK